MNGLHCRIAATKPKLMPKHVVARLMFCESKIDWTISDWIRVIFTDDSEKELNPRRTQDVRRPTGPRQN